MFVPDEYGSFRRELAAKLRAVRGMSSDSRFLVLEDVLRALNEEAPSVGSLAGDLLGAFGTEESRQVADHLRRLNGPYASSPFESGDAPLQVDLLLVTVKPAELEACQLAFGIDESEDEGRLLPDGQNRAWAGTFGGTSFALVKIGFGGNVRAALTVLDLARYFRPRLAVLIGMAGGIQKVSIGDVVIPSLVYDYEFARLTRNGSEDQSFVHQASGDLGVAFGDAVRTRAWRSALEADLDLLFGRFRGPNEMPSRGKVDVTRFEVTTDPLMSGGKLFEAGKKIAKEHALKVNSKIVAVEMEGAGFGAACTHLGWNWRTVRGIADLANPGRPKYNQRLATYGAALYVRVHFPAILDAAQRLGQ